MRLGLARANGGPKAPAEGSRPHAWRAGDSYDLFMGRWSRRLAPRFLEWLGAPDGLTWLEIGCGTGGPVESHSDLWPAEETDRH